ncbi:MviM Predicted dehydrogenases and related proteins [Rhabdaerophilaceae bacterium]
MSGRVRVACVGTGYFGRFQYRAWTRMDDVNLVALCNRSREKADEFAQEFDVPLVFSDLAEMLKRAKPDLLDIITPPETHLAAIRIAAEHGVDVICQKPFCSTLAEALQALESAEKAGISLTVHENFRFQPWHRAIRRFVHEQRMGQVYQATFRLRPGDGQGPSAYLGRQPYFQKMPRFLVHETAIHLIDVFRSLFGEVHAVVALLRRLNPAIKGEDSGLFILDMADGTRCVFDGNRLSDHAARNCRLTMGEFVIEGEAGVLSLDGDGGLQFRPHGSATGQSVAYPWDNIDFGGDCVYLFQRHVIDHRLGRGMIETSGRDYLANIRVEEAIYESNDTGRRLVF